MGLPDDTFSSLKWWFIAVIISSFSNDSFCQEKAARHWFWWHVEWMCIYLLSQNDNFSIVFTFSLRSTFLCLTKVNSCCNCFLTVFKIIGFVLCVVRDECLFTDCQMTICPATCKRHHDLKGNFSHKYFAWHALQVMQKCLPFFPKGCKEFLFIYCMA